MASVAALAQPHSDDLRCAVHAGTEVCVLRLEGSLRAPAARDGARLIAQISASPHRSLLVDASLLSDIDDVGIGLLRDLQQAVQARDGKMSVYGATGSVARALDDSHLRS